MSPSILENFYYLKRKTLSFSSLSVFFIFPALHKHKFNFSLHRFAHSGNFFLMESCDVWGFVTGFFHWNNVLKIHPCWTSLVEQWKRICLPAKWHGFDPLPGKISHVEGQLSPSATTPEALMPKALQQVKSLQWEARTLQWRVAPHSP